MFLFGAICCGAETGEGSERRGRGRGRGGAQNARKRGQFGGGAAAAGTRQALGARSSEMDSPRLETCRVDVFVLAAPGGSLGSRQLGPILVCTVTCQPYGTRSRHLSLPSCSHSRSRSAACVCLAWLAARGRVHKSAPLTPRSASTWLPQALSHAHRVIIAAPDPDARPPCHFVPVDSDVLVPVCGASKVKEGSRSAAWRFSHGESGIHRRGAYLSRLDPRRPHAAANKSPMYSAHSCQKRPGVISCASGTGESEVVA